MLHYHLLFSFLTCHKTNILGVTSHHHHVTTSPTLRKSPCLHFQAPHCFQAGRSLEPEALARCDCKDCTAWAVVNKWIIDRYLYHLIIEQSLRLELWFVMFEMENTGIIIGKLSENIGMYMDHVGIIILELYMTGWWFQPLWNILVNGMDYPVYYRKTKIMFQTTNQ